ncbi:hypothetical protein NEPAR06_1722 [Nematocida parisii]|nr:hypothetical protein NEPAR06_1722 [Nematocida parisii]
MVIGVIVKLEFLSKRVVNCNVISTTTALLQNNKKVWYVTFTVSSNSAQKEKDLFSSISIGHAVSVNGHAKTSRAEHIFARVNNIKILDRYSLLPSIFFPSISRPWSRELIQKRPDEAVPAMVLVAKLVCKKYKCLVHCVDSSNQYFKLTLQTDKHIIEHRDILLLTNVLIDLSKKEVCTQSTSTIEINPTMTLKAIAQLQSNLRMRKQTIQTVKEIDTLKKDTSILLEGRVFSVCEEKRSVCISNAEGGVSVKLEAAPFQRFMSKLMSFNRFSSIKELHASLAFCKVSLTADVLILNSAASIQNVDVNPSF